MNFYIFAALVIIPAVVCAYLLARAEWVFRVRTDMIWTDLERYKRLPSYDAMVFRFPFTWTVEGIERKAGK